MITTPNALVKTNGKDFIIAQAARNVVGEKMSWKTAARRVTPFQGWRLGIGAFLVNKKIFFSRETSFFLSATFAPTPPRFQFTR